MDTIIFWPYSLLITLYFLSYYHWFPSSSPFDPYDLSCVCWISLEWLIGGAWSSYRWLSQWRKCLSAFHQLLTTCNPSRRDDRVSWTSPVFHDRWWSPSCIGLVQVLIDALRVQDYNGHDTPRRLHTTAFHPIHKLLHSLCLFLVMLSEPWMEP